MAASGMGLRSGRVLGVGAPGPPPPPIPVPGGIGPPNTLMGLPRAIRQIILQTLFQGLPRMNFEDLTRPQDLAALYLVGNAQLYAEAEEAFLRACTFEVYVMTASEQTRFIHGMVLWGQAPAMLFPPALPVRTLQVFRGQVARAQLLSPSRGSLSWGWSAYNRVQRTAGEFPWNTCNQWLRNAGKFIQDVDYKVISPIRAYPPMVPNGRRGRLMWDWLVTGICSVQVLPGAPPNVSVVETPQTYTPGPAPPGLMRQWPPPPAVAAQPYPYWPPEAAVFTGQCQRAAIEATRLRQTYVAAAAPPVVPGFTGFDLRDLREIAKAFSEPSIYRIQP